MRSAYLWCPAYPLTDQSQLARARELGARLADAVEARLVESPLLARLGRAGDWPPADERIADLQRGLGCDWLLAARGGHGCIDLAPALDQALAGRPLPGLVGYSDLTVLHAAWRRRGGPETVHGLMPGVAAGERALASTIACLRGEAQVWTPDRCPEASPLRAGRAEGWLFAGCLRLLAALCGTPHLPSLSGALLALEDVDERPYAVDRDLAQLHAAGALNGVRGLLAGSLRAPLPPGYSGPSARDIAARWADRLAVPAVFGLPMGHEPDPIALPCGRPSRLEVDGGSWRLAIDPGSVNAGPRRA